jgi:hypothetical protein
VKRSHLATNAEASPPAVPLSLTCAVMPQTCRGSISSGSPCPASLHPGDPGFVPHYCQAPGRCPDPQCRLYHFYELDQLRPRLRFKASVTHSSYPAWHSAYARHGRLTGLGRSALAGPREALTGSTDTYDVHQLTQVIQWLYKSVQRLSRPGDRAGEDGGGGKGSEERAAGKRPRSPSVERRRSPSPSPSRSRKRPAEKEASGREGSGRGTEVGGGAKEIPKLVPASGSGGTGPEGKGNDGAKSSHFDTGASSADTFQGPGPDHKALEEVLRLVNRMCRHGDGCLFQGQDQDPCPSLHSADVKALELPPWARETALTFMGAHPSANCEAGHYDRFKWRQAETAWMGSSKELARRWVDKPELVETEAPAVPAPHPDAAPSGAPRGVKRDELVELKGLVQQLCFRGTKQCPFRSCRALHPGALTISQPSEWVRVELERMNRNQPYNHLTPETYERSRIEAVERAWKAGLIRQVDKWIEWHDAAGSRS